ncbi:YgaP family membrane protein [Aromatoleum sp.]|uniref:YgaP family membrane protein n=1 Tax=Aromatoleum sp. TaxID=2307007 RepID=UPI002FCAA203
MTSNVGGIDKVLRIVAGIALLILATLGIGAPWTWFGVVPLATGLLGWCPAYSIFGLKTCPLKKA